VEGEGEFYKRAKISSFPRSRVGMHQGTLLRPGSAASGRAGKVPVSPPVWDAGASGEFRSHAGAWE